MLGQAPDAEAAADAELDAVLSQLGATEQLVESELVRAIDEGHGTLELEDRFSAIVPHLAQLFSDRDSLTPGSTPEWRARASDVQDGLNALLSDTQRLRVKSEQRGMVRNMLLGFGTAALAVGVGALVFTSWSRR